MTWVQRGRHLKSILPAQVNGEIYYPPVMFDMSHQGPPSRLPSSDLCGQTFAKMWWSIWVYWGVWTISPACQRYIIVVYMWVLWNCRAEVFESKHLHFWIPVMILITHKVCRASWWRHLRDPPLCIGPSKSPTAASSIMTLPRWSWSFSSDDVCRVQPAISIRALIG